MNKLKYEDYYSIEMCLGILQFLKMLNIKCVVDSIEKFECIIEEFCPECHIPNDDCDCHGQHDCDHDDADRAYDAWKDSQLERQANSEDEPL